MKIINAVFHINTADMRDLSENIQEVLEKVNKYLTNIKKTNVPANAPANLPRLIANDLNNLFNIVMTNNSIEIKTIKPEDCNDEVIFEQMMTIVDKLGTAFEDYSDQPFRFCGYSVTAKLTTTEVNDNPTDFVAGRINGMDSELIVDNAMIRKCFIQGDYYINLTLRNDKQMKVTAPSQNAKPKSIEITDEFIIAEIDVNDKYAYLNKPEYECEIENALVLCEDMGNFYRDKFLQLVQTGSFDYFK